ncbi:MAG: hypothetical protein VZR09_05535 [Candidatus Gastranaerophilaceae bacterium]|nr:hypothetical protein [Candidatus Gastranaerophilaceae bacterium]
MKKKFLVLAGSMLCLTVLAQAVMAFGDDTMALKRDLKVLTKGEAIEYPIPNGTTIECYGKKLDGSIDAFSEYNEYFYMIDGKLYSDTLRKLYQPERKNPMKRIRSVKLTDNGSTIQIYDPLFEWSLRHHKRVVKINKDTGTYFMKGVQDNWRWYRNIIATGYCRAIKP